MKKNYKLKTGKFGTYFEHQGVAITNKEILEKLIKLDSMFTLLSGAKTVKKKLKAVGPRTKKDLAAMNERLAEHKKRLHAKLPPKPKKVNDSFMRRLKPSDKLAIIVGKELQPRTRVVSKIWDYVKKHNLQDPKNKRNIICDEKLASALGVKACTMFELAGIIGKNLSETK